MRIFSFSLLCIALISCASTITNTEDEVVHVVLVWLKEPGNQQHIDEVIAATKQLKVIDEVIQLHVGTSIPSDRNIVDDSFDVGLYMIFASVADMQRYLEHPKHKNAVKTVIKPLADKLLVFDFTDQSQ